MHNLTRAAGTGLTSGLSVCFTPAAPPEGDWRGALPTLRTSRLLLRELQPSDASALISMIASDEVTRFISPPPCTLEGFQTFIEWSTEQRSAGNLVCFGVVPVGMGAVVGLFQIRRMDATFKTAEWGFALGSPFWGTGLFLDGARLALDFAFGRIGVQRMEARSVTVNGRGCGALRKIGAVQEGILRKSFLKNGRYVDQGLWSIVADDWYQSNPDLHLSVH